MHSPAGGREGNATQAGQRGGKEKGKDWVKDVAWQAWQSTLYKQDSHLGQDREGQRQPPLNNAWLLLSAAGEGLVPHPRAAAGHVTSHFCLRPQGEACVPSPRSPLPFQPVCPKSTIWGNLTSWVGPHFQTVCFLTGETHPPHRHREPAPKVCPHRLMSQAFQRRTPTGLTEDPWTASVCLVTRKLH